MFGAKFEGLTVRKSDAKSQEPRIPKFENCHLTTWDELPDEVKKDLNKKIKSALDADRVAHVKLF